MLEWHMIVSNCFFEFEQSMFETISSCLAKNIYIFIICYMEVYGIHDYLKNCRLKAVSRVLD